MSDDEGAQQTLVFQEVLCERSSKGSLLNRVYLHNNLLSKAGQQVISTVDLLVMRDHLSFLTKVPEMGLSDFSRELQGSDIPGYGHRGHVSTHVYKLVAPNRVSQPS